MPDFEIITQGSLASNANSIDFTSIPATYQHLELVINARDATTAVASNPFYGYLNNDQTSAYGEQKFTSLASGAVSGTTNYSATNSALIGGYATGTTMATGAFATTRMWFPNYQLRSSFQPAIIFECAGMADSAGAGGITQVGTWSWSGTAAINQITLFQWALGGATEFAAGTSYYLAGYKG